MPVYCSIWRRNRNFKYITPDTIGTEWPIFQYFCLHRLNELKCFRHKNEKKNLIRNRSSGNAEFPFASLFVFFLNNFPFFLFLEDNEIHKSINLVGWLVLVKIAQSWVACLILENISSFAFLMIYIAPMNRISRIQEMVVICWIF